MCKELSTRFTLTALVLAAGTVTANNQALGEPNKVEKAASAKVSIVDAINAASENI